MAPPLPVSVLLYRKQILIQYYQCIHKRINVVTGYGPGKMKVHSARAVSCLSEVFTSPYQSPEPFYYHGQTNRVCTWIGSYWVQGNNYRDFTTVYSFCCNGIIAGR